MKVPGTPWEKCTQPNTPFVYYYNSTSGESTWDLYMLLDCVIVSQVTIAQFSTHCVCCSWTMPQEVSKAMGISSAIAVRMLVEHTKQQANCSCPTVNNFLRDLGQVARSIGLGLWENLFLQSRDTRNQVDSPSWTNGVNVILLLLALMISLLGDQKLC